MPETRYFLVTFNTGGFYRIKSRNLAAFKARIAYSCFVETSFGPNWVSELGEIVITRISQYEYESSRRRSLNDSPSYDEISEDIHSFKGIEQRFSKASYERFMGADVWGQGRFQFQSRTFQSRTIPSTIRAYTSVEALWEHG